jgi:hypothetical protein
MIALNLARIGADFREQDREIAHRLPGFKQSQAVPFFTGEARASAINGRKIALPAYHTHGRGGKMVAQTSSVR